MRQVVPENHPEPIGACRTTRVQTAIWQSLALRRSKALSYMVFGIRHFPCHFCKVVPSMRFGSETGVSIYCYPPAGFQLKPATIEILCAPRCGRPVRPLFSPPEAPPRPSLMSFSSCKNSRPGRTRPMPAESTNYLLSVNGIAKSLGCKRRALPEVEGLLE